MAKRALVTRRKGRLRRPPSGGRRRETVAANPRLILLPFNAFASPGPSGRGGNSRSDTCQYTQPGLKNSLMARYRCLPYNHPLHKPR